MADTPFTLAGVMRRADARRVAVQIFLTRFCLNFQGKPCTSCLSKNYPELFALMGGQVPDLRGLFLRGADAGRGIDAGRTVGTYQADAVGPHTHPLSLWRHSADGGGIYAYAKWDGFDNSIWTRENTGSETRPKNVAVRYLVRAQP